MKNTPKVSSFWGAYQVGWSFIKDFAKRAIFRRTPQESELSDGLAWNANLFPQLYLGNNAQRCLDGPPSKTKSHPFGWRFAWWTIKDSNLGPTGYEPVALTN